MARVGEHPYLGVRENRSLGIGLIGEGLGGGCGTRKMGIGDKDKHVRGCENAIIYMGIYVRLLMKWLDIFLLSTTYPQIYFQFS
jgi:hypothetical protein